MPKDKPVVLVVDAKGDATRSLIAFLRQHDLEVLWARDGESAFNALDATHVDCMVTELRGRRIDGMALLRHARTRNPEVCAVVTTSRPEGTIAVEAMRLGAHDLQLKPLDPDRLLVVLQRGLSHQRLAARVAEMEDRLDERFGIERLTGRSRPIQRVLEQIRHIASTRATVLIEGEPGTGKGVVAQAIHHASPRRYEPFVWVHCGALAGALLESELFGLERGASTEADGMKRGRLEIADGGTLFLDAIGETSPAVQVRLLRFVQDRAFERVGGTETLRSDVRLIAATGRDLAAEAREGRFREDLYSRMSVVRVQMPPLRERREDIPLLVEGFIRELNREHGRRVAGITRGVLERLQHYPWPGNVRELKNTVEGMVVFARGRRPLDLSDLPPALSATEGERLDLAVGMTLEDAERRLIGATLRHSENDKTRAAAMLGIGLRTLYRKIKRYALR